MTLSLLIVTPQASFGEYIRQSLEGKYSPHVVIVDNALAAVEEFRSQNFTHAFLDTDLKNGCVLDLGLALRQMDPGLSLVIIAPEQKKTRLDAIRPWDSLPKPFHLPDLFRLFGNETFGVNLPAVDESADEAYAEMDDSLNWLQDVSKAAQHLTRLTLESSAQAALIIRNSRMWAYSGQLSTEASAELVETVTRDKKAGDLLKFIRLKSTQAEHMLYATQLVEEVNLVMVFDAETPFSTIRSQANHLAESLALSPAENAQKETMVEKKIEDEEELQALFDFDEDDENLPPISEILENVPAPNPISAASEAKTRTPVSPPSDERPAVFDEPMPSLFSNGRASTPARHSQNYTRESSPAILLGDTTPSDVSVKETRPQIAQPRDEVDLAATRISKAVPRPKTPLRINQDVDLAATRASEPEERPQTPVRAPKPEELVETRPHSITEVAGRVLVEPSSRGMYDLTYACLLLPRFDTHHLTGDLAEHLSEWMPKISVAFGWRLEYISVRPDYLQWVINVPPTTSPGYLMRIIRKQTSTRVFDDFPRLKDENPSGDFWAPGYLIMGGSQPHPSKLVKDYIKRTRERQGMI